MHQRDDQRGRGGHPGGPGPGGHPGGGAQREGSPEGRAGRPPVDPGVERAREPFAAGVLELERVLAVLERDTSSSLGVRTLRRLVPGDDAEARRGLDRVREALALLAAESEPSLAGLSDPSPLLDGGLRAVDEARMLSLRALLGAGRRLAEWFADRTDEAPELARVTAELPDLTGLEQRIDAVLDERGRVRRDASPLMARLIAACEELEQRIERGVKDVLRSPEVRAVLSDSSVHRRAGRPVLAVRAKSAGRVRGLVHDRSQSGESVFVEPQSVVELGNRLAEARADERREVERVLLELGRTVVDLAPRVRELADGLGLVELAVTAARWARRYGAHPALLPGDPGAAPGLLLRAARHPLLIEQAAAGAIEQVVPIDLRLGDSFDMLIVTGPNTGGKTLALKTAGLLALMTRCGLPVPASEGTTVPLYDRVAADIGDEQEIAQNLSTFASHLVRIRAALEHATARTLVLLDELGGGTDPDEGAALGEAVLESLLERGAPTLVSTHISKLKEFAFRNARAENACTEFDLATLSPLYQLHVGTPGESGALVIARRMGLPDGVLERAAVRTERREGELADLMEDVRAARVAAERERADAEAAHQAVREARRAVDEQVAALERRADQLEAEAQKGLEERVRDAVRGVERLRRLLPQVSADARSEFEPVLDRLEADLTGATLTDRRQTFLDSLRKGSLVYLPRYRQRMMVHKLDHDRRQVTCKLGSMKVQVSFDEVTPYESL